MSVLPLMTLSFLITHSNGKLGMEYGKQKIVNYCNFVDCGPDRLRVYEYSFFSYEYAQY